MLSCGCRRGGSPDGCHPSAAPKWPRRRTDIDPAAVGNGVVALMLAVLMSVTQIGWEAAVAYSQDVAAVFEAALTSPITG